MLSFGLAPFVCITRRQRLPALIRLRVNHCFVACTIHCGFVDVYIGAAPANVLVSARYREGVTRYHCTCSEPAQTSCATKPSLELETNSHLLHLGAFAALNLCNARYVAAISCEDPYYDGVNGRGEPCCVGRAGTCIMQDVFRFNRDQRDEPTQSYARFGYNCVGFIA